MQFLEIVKTRKSPVSRIGHFQCAECGKWESPARWLHGQQLKELGLCHDCGFWTEKIQDADEPNSVRIDGTCYWIGKEDSDEPHNWRGFGGHQFTIVFHDGRQVITTNLWCLGHIPERFRERLPDNAVFLS
jgi:predicted RNA-binding Zn-ribbon protein involved in translation (DUF1610 family)